MQLFKCLLLIVFLVVLGFAGSALWTYYQYTCLSAKTAPDTVEWVVEPTGWDEFAPHASYQFTVNGTSYAGETLFENDLYRNRWAVKQDLPKIEAREKQVWYDPNKPQHSTMDKVLPKKKLISAGVLFGIFVYFMFLGQYIARKYA